MKIEAKLWPLEWEQGFKEIWPSDLVFELAWPILKLYRDIVKGIILSKFAEEWTKIVCLDSVHKNFLWFDLLT